MIVELCVHGETKPHRAWDNWSYEDCSGGRVLEEAIIIERDTDGKWPYWSKHLVPTGVPPGGTTSWRVWTLWEVLDFVEIKQAEVNDALDALASAQETR